MICFSLICYEWQLCVFMRKIFSNKKKNSITASHAPLIQFDEVVQHMFFCFFFLFKFHLHFNIQLLLLFVYMYVCLLAWLPVFYIPELIFWNKFHTQKYSKEVSVFWRGVNIFWFFIADWVSQFKKSTLKLSQLNLRGVLNCKILFFFLHEWFSLFLCPYV